MVQFELFRVLILIHSISISCNICRLRTLNCSRPVQPEAGSIPGIVTKRLIGCRWETDRLKTILKTSSYLENINEELTSMGAELKAIESTAYRPRWHAALATASPFNSLAGSSYRRSLWGTDVDEALNSRQLGGMHLTDYLFTTVKYKPLIDPSVQVQLMSNIKKFKFNQIFVNFATFSDQLITWCSLICK